MNVQRREFLGAVSGAPLIGEAKGQPSPFNEIIEQARQSAIQALQPSRKDLEHGLELHANSIVIDAYGFSPTSAPDGDALRAAAEAGASDIELKDLREEMTMTRHVANEAERAEYMEAWRASGVTCIFQNAGEEGQDPLRLIKRLSRFTYVTDMLRDFIGKAATPDEIVAAKKQGKRCLYFINNGVPLTQHWVSVEDELRYIRVFFQLGVRMMELAYNRRNMIGDGCMETSDAGLSDFGRAVIGEMNRVGVLVDTAHAGRRTALEAAKASALPIVESHGGCAAVHEHLRNKPDEVIRAIVDTGGYIGICCIPGYLGRTQDIRALIDHIDYAAKRFGADHVAIGTDVAYSSRNTAQENRKLPSRGRTRSMFEQLWQPQARSVGDSAGRLALSWTNWPLFTVGLVQRGYSDADIQQILGGNSLRVARAVLAGRRSEKARG